ncbi:threonine dehydratase [Polymorphum gilvum]|uniref:Threonine dehydratase, putative n=1 Tax=Polymorphum gilvum (strain LMG 25793 / CGMCC 1.9160 / SL003B-26A1) TaxID=991905 RepID=F2J0Y9_POLGS|nr:threonine dehydratase [Polymorphum gilvum]ADZ71935.1 Threonine dehydratase, putative [Polymorphum gilvum SL003B-26A1]
MLTLAAMEDAARIVYRHLSPTPQYAWPLLREALGAEVWVKHENHTPVGAFKVRGGLAFMAGLARHAAPGTGVISATRGNHGQSIAFAAGRFGMKATIVVPLGNSKEKNAAMRALGADLIEHGEDFDAAKAHAARLCEERRLVFVPSFHADLVSGVATYALEFLRACPDLAAVYVPIGLGSGICGMISARNALGLKTRIIGVVSEAFDAYARSVETGGLVETGPGFSFADGMAVRMPDPNALAVIREGAERIVRVSDQDIVRATRLLYRATHNLAEGAGAAALAALAAEKGVYGGHKVGVVLSGQNIDRDWMATILTGGVPAAAP